MRKILIFANLVLSSIAFSSLGLLVSVFDGSGDRLYRLARLWAAVHLNVSGVRVTLTGYTAVKDPPYIFMANHQSALDIFALLYALPLSFRWIAKRQLFLIPFLGWAMWRAGHISLDREHPREAIKALDGAAARVRTGRSIVVFPEGTRSKTGRLLPFKKGSFSLVFKAGVPVVPVGVRGTWALQPPGSFIPRAAGAVEIRLGEPITVTAGKRAEKDALIERVRAAIEDLSGAGGAGEDT